ncbi:hypothetical protein [Accumulibacter sp.]|uniref:hypothetical protein n=1 Tax=Accumulibacter sp. TaxID=2053492 RepID=UPI00261EBFC4|nr:hypothetical protein [Accumulibacter sp.]
MPNKLGISFKAVIALSMSLAVPLPIAIAQQSAEALVASKRPADMSYRDLMQILGRALNWIQDGVLLQNKQLVREDVNVVVNHPAPRHKPWMIMETADQGGFKQALLAYDRILDAKANAVASAAENPTGWRHRRHWANSRQPAFPAMPSGNTRHADE